MCKRTAICAILILMLWVPGLYAQTSSAVTQSATVIPSEELPLPGGLFGTPAYEPAAEPAPIISTAPNPIMEGGVQTKRIVGLVPNFQAVSADVVLPPLTTRQKFELATRSSFDYSAFAFAGLQSAIEQASNTYPEFQGGEAGFARYYWHTFADQTVGNYLTGAILPSLTHEDPRYYTHYHGNVLHRTVYAFSRLVITRTDAGNETFNISEIVGTGVATEVSGLYYPKQERASLGGTGVRWATQLLSDGVTNVFEEFWPDINHKLFHER
jgi:hypothetical protein